MLAWCADEKNQLTPAMTRRYLKALTEEMIAMQDKSTRFMKPTLDEIKLAMSKAGLPESEADRFHSYYEANGWKVGRVKMQSWQHAVGNWAMNYKHGQSRTAQQAKERELKEIDRKLNALEASYPGMQTWSDEDWKLKKQLKQRKRELTK